MLIKLLLSAEKMTGCYISLTIFLATNVNAFFMCVYPVLLSHIFIYFFNKVDIAGRKFLPKGTSFEKVLAHYIQSKSKIIKGFINCKSLGLFHSCSVSVFIWEQNWIVHYQNHDLYLPVLVILSYIDFAFSFRLWILIYILVSTVWKSTLYECFS